MSVDYDHSQNVHTLGGARAALSALLGGRVPLSLLDVGCGTGTWLCAAADLGIGDVFGVDGVDVPGERFHAPKNRFRQIDLSRPFDLNRRFETVLCLEVAEHLPERAAASFVDSLTRHGDRIIFSAACPGQPGQHHVNCRWPQYWQELFNSRGFICDDELRWRIWRDKRIEPWYRQNVFLAQKNSENAGREPRIEAVLHPDMWPYLAPVPGLSTWPPVNLLLNRVRKAKTVARRSLGLH